MKNYLMYIAVIALALSSGCQSVTETAEDKKGKVQPDEMLVPTLPSL
jgi:uncharacterized protein YceK|tara:strand:+ start:123 stop:263 length:141 start_codon:yes stop_codon:yes gene_type:complete